MNAKKAQFKSVDEYIESFPADVQKLLNQKRSVIKKTAPDAEEKISWRMPGYFQNGILLFYAAHAHHIGFYALPGAIKALGKDLKGYTVSKGTIQFPFEKPLPLALIKKIVKFRVKENEVKVTAKVEKGKDTRHKNQRRILELFGSVRWEGD